ncbi:Rpn family recombination-promoting nuclease/putative transposase [Treponema sp. OMZ 906]|uniref:Rpn family recombination-promoting nuclease/putative transposase n=1 Tax=Treponema sp. OMZ 906 TaxID=2563662 RepID=UPI0020A28881|nr:Rpn family recombination-promoting nuclease/putative transposase [Treponema sp. OMZ 906]UTC54727.1 Rpn family recombination-promoting nuclease/putative transposase [Treponema sp. OMZ 906]
MKKHNRRYKDSVFVDFFSEDRTAKANFLALYNALHGTDYQSTAILKNIRLKQVLYMSFANDVSYLVDNKIIVLAEHQSTINPNMPIRCLEYIARLYEQFYKSKEKYSRKQLAIPTPEFYVFYNGKEPYRGDSLLKLSDSFTQTHDEYALELSVKVVNINYDKTNEILKLCKPLKQYSLFVDAVRRNIAVDKEHGFEKAIKECIQNDILREYLQRKSKEVLNMLIGEYDYDTDIAVQREESFDMGRLEGSLQAKLETARLMKQANCEIPFIAKMTGLTQAEVESICNG